eukprot:6204460-Pleurochrysis_carterae.AAC.1
MFLVATVFEITDVDGGPRHNDETRARSISSDPLIRDAGRMKDSQVGNNRQENRATGAGSRTANMTTERGRQGKQLLGITLSQ